MSELRVWPHLTIVAVICAALAGGGVALWMRHRQNTDAQTLLSAARIERTDGDVALQNENSTANDPNSWVTASANQPFSVGDRIYTRENSHASLAFTGRNFARLYPNTSLDVLSLNERQTQLALREGSAVFDVGYLAPSELFEVATPYGAVDLNQPGLYNVGIDNGNVIVSVLSGLAQVVGLGGSGQISKGEMLTLLGQTASDVVLTRLNGRDAGYFVDDYYSSQYPNYYDGRYRNYDTYLSDPYYFDPYRRNASYRYVSEYLPGLNDLDYYGDWQNVDGYGYCWHPRVDSGWAPYEQGYWMNDYPYGPTWVSNEPWGYTPYHYGRWAYSGNQWFWVPDRTSTPIYSPALVAFVPFDQNNIGWVPLGPSDTYAPRYYGDNWQPTYLTRTDLIQRNLANLYVPGAVTVLPISDFTRGDWRNSKKADRQMLAQVNPVLDPLTLTPLRNAVIHSAWGRGDKSIPPGIAKRLQDTAVVTSAQPVAPPYRRNLADNMRVRTAPGNARGRQFKVQDQRGPQNPRSAEANPPAAPDNSAQRVERGNQVQPRTEPQQLRQERRTGPPQAQGERVGLPQSRPQPPAHMNRGNGQIRTMPAPQANERRAPVRVEQPRALPRRVEQPRVMPQQRVPQQRQAPPQAQPIPRPVPQPRPQPPTGGRENRGQPPANAPAARPQQQPRAQGGPPKAQGGPPKAQGGPPAKTQPSGGPPEKGKGHKKP